VRAPGNAESTGTQLAEEHARFQTGRYWLTSASVGLKSITKPGFRLQALNRVLNPLSFPRPAEFRASLYSLAPQLDSGRVLDIGSPKLPAVVLARERPTLELYLTDILEDFIAPTRHFLKVAGCGDDIGTRIHLGTEDARCLSYPDSSFDWVYAISVLEHVADEDRAGLIQPGDSLALQEIARVLKPGGVVTLTVPFDPRGYWEEYTSGPVYERGSDARSKTFYQRHYDDQAIRKRLIEPSGLELDARILLGEGARIKVEPWWNRIPMQLKAPLLPFQGLAGNLLFKALDESKKASARGLALRLSKQNPA
jgi:ubiquinone/menaquinone biosynthesis C-methylase UbiE